jgi:hypothetical protein
MVRLECVLLLDNVDRITINWKNKNSEIKTTSAKIGSSLLQVAHRDEIDLEGSLHTSLLIEFTLSQEHVVVFVHVRRVMSFWNKKSLIIYQSHLKRRKICWTWLSP